MALMSRSFPGGERCINFQVEIFALIFCRMLSKCVLFAALTSRSHPRYLPRVGDVLIPKGFLVSEVNLLGVFGLNIIEDLS